MLSLFLHHLLKGPLGFSTAGVAVDLDDGPLIMYAKLSVLLTDGEGWRRLWMQHSITSQTSPLSYAVFSFEGVLRPESGKSAMAGKDTHP